MRARYLVRFDDVCPTMQWSVWARIEPVLSRHNINPILSVVPDNLDPKLMVAPARDDFWEQVRAWQARGWAIALHGYQHLYETEHPGLMGINAYSEFAGLPYEIQRGKMVQALAVFAQQGVRADAWVAPAHAFDATTVKVLIDLAVNIINDGFYWRPVKRFDALWIPQQMWRFRSMPFGVWTVCYHHNRFSEAALCQFERDIDRFASNIVSLDQVVRKYPARTVSFIDNSFAAVWLAVLRLKLRLMSS